MKIRADGLYSVWGYLFSTHVDFHAFLLVFIFLEIPVFSGNNPSDLLSRQIQTILNSNTSIVLQWDIPEQPTESEHTILLFVHGPINSATYYVKSFDWKQIEDGEVIKTGKKNNLPEDMNRRVPTVRLKEFGYMAGSRVAALTIRFLVQSQYRQNGGRAIDFPKGQIEIRFIEQDPLPFDHFSKALDETAQTIFTNYPPLTRIDNDPTIFEEMPYIKNPSFKLITNKSGLYEVYGYTLLDEWHPQSIQTSEIALFQNQISIPRIVVDQNGQEKKSGKLKPTDRLHFFAPESQSSYSPDVVTWLTLNSESSNTPNLLTLSPGKANNKILHRQIYLEEDAFHINGRKRNEKQNHHWMWHEFADGEFESGFTILENVADASAVIRIKLDIKNDSYPIKSEQVIASVNQTQVTGTITHNSEHKFEFEGQFRSTVFNKENVVNISIQKAFQQANQVNLDSIEILYPVTISQSEDPFYNPFGLKSLSVPNDSKSVWAIQSQLERVVTKHNRVQTNTNSVTLDDSNDVSFYFLPNSAELPSPTISVSVNNNQRTVLNHTSKQADVLILSPRKWNSLFTPFTDALHQQSLTSTYIAVEDIYDVFGDGRMSPETIRDFLRFAYQTWEKPKPSYVLLVGDATWDYWGRYKNGIVNEIPSYQSDQNYAIENWYVRTDIPDDPLPDMVIARIPVRTADELQSVLDKTIAYRNDLPIDDWLNKTLVLTDNEFEQYTEELLEDWLPKGIQTYHRHVADYPLVDNIYLPARMRAEKRAKTSLAATEDLIDILGEGVFLWQFFGHGAPNVMGKERLFFGGGSKFSDVKKLTANHKPHVLWSFSCETTRFDYPHGKWNISIGEDLLTLRDGGAIALMGAAGRGYPQDHVLLARGLHEAAFDYGISTFGLQYYTGQLLGLAFKPGYEPIDQFAIFGDPALPMPRFVSYDLIIEESGENYDVRTENNGTFPNPVNGYSWFQNENRTQFDTGKRIDNNTFLPLQMDIEKNFLQQFYPGKTGFHAIKKENGRTVIAHGAVDIPEEESTSSYIEPSTGKLPDLTFKQGSLVIKPQSPRSGETVFVEVEILNTGNASARNISIQGYKVSESGGEAPFDVIVGEKIKKIGELNPGQSKTIKLRWDGTANAGENTLRIKVDPNSVIKESNDNNNTIDSQVSVRKKADLIISDENVSIEKSADGQKLMVTFQVFNMGESKAERVVIEFKVVINGEEIIQNFPIDPETRQFTPGIIEVGEAYPPSRNPIGLPANLESFSITVDPDEIVDEETHENNTYTYSPN